MESSPVQVTAGPRGFAIDALSSVRFNYAITGTRTEQELDLAWEERAGFAELIAANLRDIYLPELKKLKDELASRTSSEHEANAHNEELRKYEHKYLTRIKGLEEQITELQQNLENLNEVIAKYKAKTIELEKECVQTRLNAANDVDELIEQLKDASDTTARAEEGLGTANQLIRISQMTITGLKEELESLRKDVKDLRQHRETDGATQFSEIVDEAKLKPSRRASSLPPGLKDRKKGHDRFSPKTSISWTVFKSDEDDTGPSSPTVHNTVKRLNSRAAIFEPQKRIEKPSSEVPLPRIVEAIPLQQTISAPPIPFQQLRVNQTRALKDLELPRLLLAEVSVREFDIDPIPPPKNRSRLPKHLRQLQKYLYYVLLTISYFGFIIVAWCLSWSIFCNFDNPELICELQRARRESSYMTLVYLLILRPVSFGTIMVELSFYCQGQTRPIWTRFHSLLAMAFVVFWLYVFNKVLNKWLPRLKPIPEGRGGKKGGRRF